MKFYDFNEIISAGDCAQVARDVFGAEIHNNRCATVWRGGDNREAVAIDKEQWFDHVSKEGGSVITLLSLFKFDGNTQSAQEYLGDLYNLTPKYVTGAQPASSDCRYERLKREGYTETARYQ